MNRPDIIARVLDRVQFLTGYAPDVLSLAKPLMGQGWLELDSIDLMEIAMALEEEFALLVYPQFDAMPEEHDMPGIRHKFLQPLDDADRDANTAAAIAYCLDNPQWRLSLQTHKWTGIR